jgi:DnaJ-class molecular chaperone
MPESEGPFRFTYARPEYDPHTKAKSSYNGDHYATLQIRKDATQDEVKRAYRKLAREMHPDVNPDPETQERFKEVTQTYEVLSDTDKRGPYDRGLSFNAAFNFAECEAPPPRPNPNDTEAMNKWLADYSAYAQRLKDKYSAAGAASAENTQTGRHPRGGTWFRRGGPAR